ncbi:MAG TPA: HlyD family efflux transporter periplasmic adaptor subunit [Gemmatimonadaceae bacterium]|nr:HlyD family efflux transporter periplasmic adaptor subunit [Gemmatimonadaceae bacterium]
MRRFPSLLVLGTLALAACADDDAPDAYGNFEADDIAVAAQVAGPILRFDAVEGQTLAAGTLVAVIDTIPLALERQQLVAQRGVIGARRRETAAQLASIEAQLAIAERSLARVQRLREGDAATATQLDGAEREATVLRAQREALTAGDASLGSELASLDARLAAVADRIARAQVRSPVAGTVLATYARLGETAQPGQALFSIADLGTLTLRAYVTGDQLTSFALGQRVTVRVTAGDSSLALPGEIAWVSSRAEFTPTPIQTRDERADLVYAVKVRVADPQGRLKIGMPGDVTLADRP